MAEPACHVLGEHVRFEVEARAGPHAVQDCCLEGLRNQRHLEGVVAQGSDGQGYAVQTDTALVDDL